MSGLIFTRRFLPLLFINLAFSLSISVPSFAQTSSQDEVRLRSFVERYFAAYEKKDLPELLGLWSQKSPDLAANRKSLQDSFAATQKIEIKALTIDRVIFDGAKAQVRLGVEIQALDAKSSKPLEGFGKLNRTLHMVKESGEWKLWQNLSAEQQLAAALAETKTEAERKTLMAANKDLAMPELLQALLVQGNQLYLQSKHSQALAIFELAGEIANQLGDKNATTALLRGIGNVHLRQGNFTRAIEYYQTSLKTAEGIGNQAGIATAFNNIGVAHRLQGNYKQALEYYQRSLKIREEIHDKAGISASLNNLGVVYRLQGNYLQALEYYQRSLKIAEETGGKAGIGAALNNLGVIYRLQGNFTQALDYYQKSLNIREEIGDKVGIGEVINNIGSVYQSQGNYIQAFEYYQKGLKIAEEIDSKTGIIITLNNMGSVHIFQSNYIQAFEYYQKGLKIAEAIGDQANIANSLNNMGFIQQSQDNSGEASEYYQKSLKIREEIGDQAGIANTLNNIGYVHQAQGDYAKAIEYYQKSLKIAEAIGDVSDMSTALGNLGVVHRLQGNYQQAIEFANRTANLSRQIGTPSLIWEAGIVAGMSYQALHQDEQAKKAFTEAIAAIEETRNQIAGDEQQRQQFFAEKLSPYYGMITLLLGQNNPTEALAFAERAKARSLLDVLQSGKLNITKAMSPAEKQQEQQLNSHMVSLNAQIYKEKLQPQQDRARLNDLTAQLQKARLEMEAFQTSLYAAHPELKIQRGQAQTISLQEAAGLIPDHKTALLEFVVSEDQTYLFVLSKGASQTAPDFQVYKIDIKQKELAKLCREYRKQLADRRISYQDLATRLYDLLFKPARAQLLSKTNLIIIPDGVLWELPFQTLQPARNHFLIEDAAISYAPSLTVLQKMVKARQKRSPTPANTLLAVGNPSIGSETSARLKTVMMDDPLLPLPEAERQVKLLQQLYTPARSKVYIGKQAGEAKVKAEAGDSRILHIATHGILNDASPMYSQIVLAQSEGDANEDGLLEAWEIMNLELKADLVVLSACETARGKLGAGEGMIGLAWALFVAGSPATVVSQWKVESASTTELMVEFHKRLKSGSGPQSTRLTKAEALRRAALKLMKVKAYKHPFYWAAFVIIGNAS
jgi:CHAT domain-containing protein/tetratricopeptide (TPR) repeat protein